MGSVLGNHLSWLHLASFVAWWGSRGPLKSVSMKERAVLGEVHFHALEEQLSRSGLHPGETSQEVEWRDAGHCERGTDRASLQLA